MSSTPKLSKFLRSERRDPAQSPSRDREGTNTTSGGSPANESSSTVGKKLVGKKGSKLFSRNKADTDGAANNASADPSLKNSRDDYGGNRTDGNMENGINDPPVIIEPPSNSKPRPRPPRTSTGFDNPNFTGYSSRGQKSNSPTSTTFKPTSSSSASVRNLPMGDFPSRLSGWFSHTFSGSSTDLSLPHILSSSNLSSNQVLAGSPRTKTPHALITAAKHGKDHLDKAMRYLLDSDAQPDKNTDKIWLLGVQHPGYEAPPPPSTTPPSTTPATPSANLPIPSKRNHRRDSTESRNKSPSAFRNPIPTAHSNSSTQSLSSAVSSSTSGNPKGPVWPSGFYSDYTSRIWLTYRNAFPPIRDTSLDSLEPVCGPSSHCSTSSTDVSQPPPSPAKPRWPWSGEKGWTSDAGWGCMLRTGQSLLANALIHLHLSREWRRPNQANFSPDFIMYVRILTWFLDNPSGQAPFGVHRMALAGKELGKEVGSWFGPSTAAGAIKRLVGEFEDAGLEIVVAVDSSVYECDVYAASAAPRGRHARASTSESKASTKHKKGHVQKWGDRAVLVLVGIRLGIDGVNPIYYESVKTLFTFPQSVGIAGGRPSSSYYFVGSQSDSLFYLDPHHSRPAVPLRPLPLYNSGDDNGAASFISTDDGGSLTSSKLGTRKGSELQMQGSVHTPDTSESERRSTKRLSIRRASLNRITSHFQQQQQSQQATPASPSSVHSSSSMSQSSVSGSHAHTQSQSSQHSTIPLSSSPLARTTMPSPSKQPPATSTPPPSESNAAAVPTSPASSNGLPRTPSSVPPYTPSSAMPIPQSPSASVSTAMIEPISMQLASAYSLAELRTFHCDRVRKMPLSGLDPSMLLGFLCRDESDWKDLRKRVSEMPKAIFHIADEPPSWPGDDDELLDLESASDQEMDNDLESPVGGDEDLGNDSDELHMKPQASKSKDPRPPAAGKDDSDESDEEDVGEGGDDEPSAVTPVAPSMKFTTTRHDTIIGKPRAETEAAAAATAAVKPVIPMNQTSSRQSHESTSTGKDSRDAGDEDEDEDDDDDDDDDWVDPVKPSPPVVVSSPQKPREEEEQSNREETRNGRSSVHRASSDRKRRGEEDTSVTPTPATPSYRSAPISASPHHTSRSLSKELPTIPTTVVAMGRESPRPSSASRRVSQIQVPGAEGPVPFPSRPMTDHRKQQSSSSSRSATSSGPISPTSTTSSQPQSQSRILHSRSQHSGHERDPSGYPFPGSATDDSSPTSSDSNPSSDAWGGDEKSSSGMKGTLVPKRERKTTVGRTVPVRTNSPPGPHVQYQQPMIYDERKSSPAKAKHGGRTISGGVKAVWKDEDGDDF